ncbi:hypothetical protein C8Q78DRAFT_1090328 [Trametes maxima]|nr:hypothetical protein C8Q78DRAFT_1090328 [Trametes maxima]
MSTSADQAISLRLHHNIYVSGCPIDGELVVNYRLLQEDDVQEIYVKLRGSAKTVECPLRRLKRQQSTYRESMTLLREDILLWTRGMVYPPPGSDLLCIPFHLPLPPYLPPSFEHDAYRGKASVCYSFTVVGVRPGALQFNRRIHRAIAIVPCDGNALYTQAKIGALVSGLEQSWKVGWRKEKIRRGLWGPRSTVEVHVRRHFESTVERSDVYTLGCVKLSVPDTPSLPILVPLPFIIHVKSITAPLTRAEADSQAPDQVIFPPVPCAFSQFTFSLYRHFLFRTLAHTEARTDEVVTFRQKVDIPLVVDVPPPKWAPVIGTGREASDGKGRWVQESTFRSTIQLDCPPSFAIDIMRCEYFLSLNVPFPGLGNDVEVRIPVAVSSGSVTPIVREGSATTQMPFLDLPPAYWDTNTREWDDHRD